MAKISNEKIIQDFLTDVEKFFQSFERYFTRTFVFVLPLPPFSRKLCGVIHHVLSIRSNESRGVATIPPNSTRFLRFVTTRVVNPRH